MRTACSRSAAFLFFNVQAIASSRLVAGPMAAISVLAGVVGLVFVGIMVIGDAGDPAVFGPIGHGGAERMIVYPVMLWLLAFGGYLMGRQRVDGAPGSSSRGRRRSAKTGGEPRRMTTESTRVPTDELERLDAWWRAANYLSVGQIYLMANPLLREPLAPGARQAADCWATGARRPV